MLWQRIIFLMFRKFYVSLWVVYLCYSSLCKEGVLLCLGLSRLSQLKEKIPLTFHTFLIGEFRWGSHCLHTSLMNRKNKVPVIKTDIYYRDSNLISRKENWCHWVDYYKTNDIFCFTMKRKIGKWQERGYLQLFGHYYKKIEAF